MGQLRAEAGHGPDLFRHHGHETLVGMLVLVLVPVDAGVKHPRDNAFSAACGKTRQSCMNFICTNPGRAFTTYMGSMSIARCTVMG